MRKATRELIEGGVEAVLVALEAARWETIKVVHGARQSLCGQLDDWGSRLDRGQHEAEDRANERHRIALDQASQVRAILEARLDSLETQIEVALGKVLERQTRSLAVQQHDRKAAAVERVTSLPTPAPKPGGTDTAVGVLKGQPVPVVPRMPAKEAKLTEAVPVSPVLDHSSGTVHHGLVSSIDAAQSAGLRPQALGRRASLGQVEGAVRGENGRWYAPLEAWRALAERVEAQRA